MQLALCNTFSSNFFALVLHFEVEASGKNERVAVSCCDVYADGSLYGSSFALQVRRFALLPTRVNCVILPDSIMKSYVRQLLNELHA